MTVRVAGIGLGRFGRRPEGSEALAREVAERALEEVGRRPIDLLVVGTMLGETFEGKGSWVPRIASEIGCETAHGLRVEAASATGAAAFHAAAIALESGRFDRALVVAVEKMTALPTPEVGRALAGALAPMEVAAGATMPGLAALVAQRYLERTGFPVSVFDAVPVHARARASMNPHAQFRTPVTPEEVAASRPIALPLRLLHCAAISDGAAAVVIERGRGPVEILGLGQGIDQFRLVDRASLSRFAATRTAAERAYAMAGLGPGEIDVAEVHDAFAPFALIDLEDLGLASAEEAARAFSADGHRTEGPWINPSGGILGRGHPVGVSGLCAIAEVALQIGGAAGARQVPDRPRRGLAQSIGGLASHNFVTILGRGEAA
ncbi:MAG: thiolase family protein [Thermoplasmata archaeon]